jgi:SIR2-like domain
MTKFHDPRVEVEKIREHLGSHDGRLAFLIGAGTSAAVLDADKKPLIPTVTALSDTCREAVAVLGDEHAEAYDTIRAQCELVLKAAAESAEPPTLTRPVNVEDILSAVRTKLSAIGDGDLIAGLDRKKLKAVEAKIRATIAEAAFPDEQRIPERLPHHKLARWAGRQGRACALELFTTNYDTLFERALEDERLSVFDGFVGARRPFFSAASLSRPNWMPGSAWTRLWKLHGSINWSMARFGDGSERIIRGAESAGGELIFPSLHK